MITARHFFLSYPMCSLSELVIDFPANVVFVSFFFSCSRLTSSLDRENYSREICRVFDWILIFSILTPNF